MSHIHNAASLGWKSQYRSYNNLANGHNYITDRPLKVCKGCLNIMKTNSIINIYKGTFDLNVTYQDWKSVFSSAMRLAFAE